MEGRPHKFILLQNALDTPWLATLNYGPACPRVLIPSVSVARALLTCCPEYLLVKHLLNLALAMLAVKRPSAVHLNVFGMDQALEHTVGKTCVAKILEARKL